MDTKKIKIEELKERVEYLREEQNKEFSQFRERNLKQFEEELKRRCN